MNRQHRGGVGSGAGSNDVQQRFLRVSPIAQSESVAGNSGQQHAQQLLANLMAEIMKVIEVKTKSHPRSLLLSMTFGREDGAGDHVVLVGAASPNDAGAVQGVTYQALHNAFSAGQQAIDAARALEREPAPTAPTEPAPPPDEEASPEEPA